MPHWPAGEGKIKIPAAWLLEQAGFVKGYGEGPAGISSRHTLALTNRGGATFADVERLQDEIVRGVRERFGIALEREPVCGGLGVAGFAACGLRSSARTCEAGPWATITSLFEANDFGVEDEGFFDVVGDGEDGDALLRGVLLHAGKQEVAERAIDPGEGFVEEDEVRGGDGEGSGEVDALALAAGEVAGQAVGEWGEVEELEGGVGWIAAGWRRMSVAKEMFWRTVRWGKRTAPCGA